MTWRGRGGAIRKRYGRKDRRTFSVEVRWTGYPAKYTIVHASSDRSAEKAAHYEAMRLALRTPGMGTPDRIIVHDDGGSLARHAHEVRGQ